MRQPSKETPIATHLTSTENVIYLFLSKSRGNVELKSDHGIDE